MKQSPSWGISSTANQEILCLYGMWNFTTMFTKGILSQMDPVHILTPYYIRSILILPFHLYLHLPSSLFPLCFLTKILYAIHITPMCATCLAHVLWSSLLCSFLQSLPLLGLDIFLRSLFSNTLSPYSSFREIDHVSQPYRIAVYVNIYVFI
jgi:hypothetical protein